VQVVATALIGASRAYRGILGGLHFPNLWERKLVPYQELIEPLNIVLE
jgi:hypothetical protein